MKRRDVYRKIWQDCCGLLKPGNRVAIAGGGISGLHLAWFLRQQDLQVTVFEPQRTGSLRIPLMHACSALKKRPLLWETAAAFSRIWYKQQAHETPSLLIRESAAGDFFVIRTRAYLRFLRDAVISQGVTVERRKLPDTTGFDLVMIAAGCEAQTFFPENLATMALKIHGWESYFSTRGARPYFTPTQAEYNEVATNFMEFPPRSGLIQRNDEKRQDIAALARDIFPNRRSALFEGVRLASPDRNPIVGFFPPSEINTYDKLRESCTRENYAVLASRNHSPFFFTAMGYHAMTYAPFLAHAVAGWLIGKQDQNMICTLTPARFLPRN